MSLPENKHTHQPLPFKKHSPRQKRKYAKVHLEHVTIVRSHASYYIELLELKDNI